MIESKRLLLAAALAVVPLSAASVQAQAIDRGAAAVARLQQAAGGRIEVTRAPGDGPVRFLSVTGGPGIAVGGANATERAQTFLAAYGEAFGLEAGEELLLVQPPALDEVGMEHVRLQQTHRGVPVTGAELVVHLRGGRVLSTNGKALPEVGVLDVTPRIDAVRAAETALAFAARQYGEGDLVASTPRLELLDVPLLGGPPRPRGLAWFVEVTRTDVREFVWVDARRGALALHFSQRPHAKKRKVYTANNGSVLPGVLRRTEGGAPAIGPDATEVNNAYDFAGDTYDYYFTRHGRNSFDGKGALITSTVDYCPEGGPCPYPNAFWNGTQMVYGEGYTAADDVVAHELTHAVTERTSRLFYYMQSGALNESFSDIFGETVDLLQSPDGDTRWELGEDLAGGAVRNLMDPTLLGQPDRVLSSNFACPSSGFEDAGGVHTNSGVPNHAYALLVDGGTFNGRTITGIGLEKAGKIEYRVLTSYLTPASEFFDAYAGALRACTDLVGTAGITQSDCTQVRNAVQAVEMQVSWPCPPGQIPTPNLCPNGQGALKPVFFDDLENTASRNWKTTVPPGELNHWTGDVLGNPAGVGNFALYFDDFPTSGKWHFWGLDNNETGISSVEMAKTVTVPQGGYLHFNHSFGFDTDPAGPTYYDGGVLSYSTDNGVNWIDADGLFQEGALYNGGLDATNPLGERIAFVGQSRGYTGTRLDLSSLAGQGVRFRFQIATGPSVGDFGWFIDDVQMYTCVPGGTVSLSAANYIGSEASGKAVITVTRTGGTAPFTVNYSTAGQTATAGVDFTRVIGTLSFGTGVMSQTITVPVLNDTEDDDAEDFVVNINNASSAVSVGPNAGAFVTITDNDSGGVIQLSAPTYKVTENAQAVITVTRSGGLASGAAVHYTLTDGSAVQPGDWAAFDGVVIFDAGQTVKKITVPIVNDTIVEGDETFTVTLDSVGGGAVLGARTTAPVTITDNDAGGVFQFKLVTVNVQEGVNPTATLTVVRTSGSASEVTVAYQTASGTAIDGSDFTGTSGVLAFAAGELSKTFTVAITDDGEPPAEPLETFTVQLLTPTGGATLGPKATATVKITEGP